MKIPKIRLIQTSINKKLVCCVVYFGRHLPLASAKVKRGEHRAEKCEE